jgi:Protein of unknown function (DUF3567)
MQLLYNSDTFAVVLFGADAAAPPAATGTAADINSETQPAAAPSSLDPTLVLPAHGGYEIVDKMARKEIYLQGLVAASFQRGVKALVDQGPDPQALEDYIASFTVLAQHPVVLH